MRVRRSTLRMSEAKGWRWHQTALYTMTCDMLKEEIKQGLRATASSPKFNDDTSEMDATATVI